MVRNFVNSLRFPVLFNPNPGTKCEIHKEDGDGEIEISGEIQFRYGFESDDDSDTTAEYVIRITSYDGVYCDVQIVFPDCHRFKYSEDKDRDIILEPRQRVILTESWALGKHIDDCYTSGNGLKIA